MFPLHWISIISKNKCYILEININLTKIGAKFLLFLSSKGCINFCRMPFFFLEMSSKRKCSYIFKEYLYLDVTRLIVRN